MKILSPLQGSYTISTWLFWYFLNCYLTWRIVICKNDMPMFCMCVCISCCNVGKQGLPQFYYKLYTGLHDTQLEAYHVIHIQLCPLSLVCNTLKFHICLITYGTRLVHFHISYCFLQFFLHIVFHRLKRNTADTRQLQDG